MWVSVFSNCFVGVLVRIRRVLWMLAQSVLFGFVYLKFCAGGFLHVFRCVCVGFVVSSGCFVCTLPVAVYSDCFVCWFCCGFRAFLLCFFLC